MAHYLETYKEPGTSVFMFVERKFKFENALDGENLVFQVFDRNGEAHGREAFSWALTLPGAQDFTRSGTMLEVAKIQGSNPQAPLPGRCHSRRLLTCDSDRVRHISGTTYQFWAPSIVPGFTPTSIKNCVEWYNGLEKAGKSIAECTYMVFELFCTASHVCPITGTCRLLTCAAERVEQGQRNGVGRFQGVPEHADYWSRLRH